MADDHPGFLEYSRPASDTNATQGTKINSKVGRLGRWVRGMRWTYMVGLHRITRFRPNMKTLGDSRQTIRTRAVFSGPGQGDDPDHVIKNGAANEVSVGFFSRCRRTASWG
ncbi:hypothetical protein LZ30DRAFT_26561 [Colletotrichum cereale]|nr:hypothetical protein LZ30DRAFT_26561 [Colletotrichum cereale]